MPDAQEPLALPLGADVQRLRDLTRGCDTLFLVQQPTQDGAHGAAAPLTTARFAHAPNARPMVFRGIDDQGCVWHFVDAANERMRALEEQGRPTNAGPGARGVALAWCDPLRGRWVAATGRATIVRDRAKMGRLWTGADAAWFPQGLATPELALLCVSIVEARYWEVEASVFARARWHLRRALGDGLPTAPPPLPTVSGTIALRQPHALHGAEG